MKSGTLFAYLVTFTASFCMMVIELVAGRILAPYIGQHLYSWTSIIGICLAGISVGAWLGGWLADKFPYRATLGWFLFFSGLLSLSIPLMTDHICSANLWKGDITLMTRIVLYTLLIFFPATMALGMISPMVIKLVVRDLKNTGSVVGRIYSFSTIGSILGTFATGFYLIEEFGTRVLLYAVGMLLIAIAPLAGGLFYSATKYVGGILAGIVLAVVISCFLFPAKYVAHRDGIINAVGQPMLFEVPYIFEEDEKGANGEKQPQGFWKKLNAYFMHTVLNDNKEPIGFWTKLSNCFAKRFPDALYLKESNYYALRVTQLPETDDETKEERILNYLILDNLTHSHSDVDDPNYLTYEYLRIYQELVGWQLGRLPSTQHKELFIGGGGYTMQRYFHNRYKDCHIDVAEIDPNVTMLAERFMGAPKNDPRLVTSNEDGRLFVLQKQQSNDKYSFIFGDAFNDLSVPFHLTTVEFDKQMKNLLTPDGLVMSLVIDDVSKGMFLPSFIATMRQAFGNDNVVLILIAKAKGRQELVEYLKVKKLDQYIPELSKQTLEEVVAKWDAKKYADEIAHLQREKLNDQAPYLKATDLDYFAGHDTVIVVGSAKPQNWDDYEKYLEELTKTMQKEKFPRKTVSHVIRPAVLTDYLASRTREPNLYERWTKGTHRVPWQPVVLTDDYAPVDNLLAPLFEQRFGYKKPTVNKRISEDEDDLVKQLLKDTEEANNEKAKAKQ